MTLGGAYSCVASRGRASWSVSARTTRSRPPSLAAYMARSALAELLAVAALGERRDADADAHAGDARHHVQLVDALADALRDLHRLVDPGAAQQHAELVAAVPGGDVAAPDRRRQDPAHPAQDVVAHEVPVAVVELLEVVDSQNSSATSASSARSPDSASTSSSWNRRWL